MMIATPMALSMIWPKGCTVAFPGDARRFAPCVRNSLCGERQLGGMQARHADVPALRPTDIGSDGFRALGSTKTCGSYGGTPATGREGHRDIMRL